MLTLFVITTAFGSLLSCISAEGIGFLFQETKGVASKLHFQFAIWSYLKIRQQTNKHD